MTKICTNKLAICKSWLQIFADFIVLYISPELQIMAHDENVLYSSSEKVLCGVGDDKTCGRQI